jgi:hypothetical protein
MLNGYGFTSIEQFYINNDPIKEKNEYTACPFMFISDLSSCLVKNVSISYTYVIISDLYYFTILIS